MTEITMNDRKILVALIWALKPSDFSIVQACLQSPPDSVIGTIKDSSNDIFFSTLEKIGLAKEMPLNLDTSIEHLSKLKSFMLTETGRATLPKAIEVSFGGYPHKEATIDDTTLKILHTYATQGEATSMNKLGTLYSEGRGVPKNIDEALIWYKKSAEKGDKLAHNNLGITYFAGIGAAKDLAEAEKWFRKAAELGSTGAMDNLGEMYMQGAGVKQDTAQGFQWFLLAANHGHAFARCKVAEFYKKGIGVEKDAMQAYVWYSLAAISGYNVSKPRDEIASTLSHEQIKEANGLVTVWKPLPIPKATVKD